MVLGENIKKLRKRANLSQLELAKLMNVKQYNISYWEINRSEPSAAQLVKLSEIFKVPVDYILGNNIIKSINENEFKTVVQNFELDIEDDLLKEIIKIFNELDIHTKKELLQTIKSSATFIK